MPELPEVETVARDLRPRIVGATIVGARVNWARTLRDAHARGVRRRRSPAVGSRPSVGAAKQLVIDLSRRRGADDPSQDDRAAVRGARGRAGGPLRPARARARRRPRAAVPRHPQVRAGRALRGATRDGELGRGDRRGAVVRRSGPSRSTPRSHCATSGVRSGAGRDASSRCCTTSRSWPASATSTPTRRSGVRGFTRSGRHRRCGRADERRLYEAIRAVLAEAVERRGRSIDDYTAPDGDGAMQERLESTSGPAGPARAAAGPSGGSSSARGRRTSARSASGSRRPTGKEPRRSCGR